MGLKLVNYINPGLNFPTNKITCLKKKKKLHSLDPSYKLPNIYMACCSSYILPKTKKTRLNLLNQRPKSEGYVTQWEGVRHPFRPD